MNHSELVSLFWAAKEILRGKYKAHEYGNVIYLNNMDFSFSLEFEIIYENYRKNNLKWVYFLIQKKKMYYTKK